MKKKIILTTLILILVPTVIFAPVFGLLIYTATNNAKNYVDEVMGNWTAIQYYYEKERIVCNEDNFINVNFGDETIAIEGTVLKEVETTFTKESGTMLSYEVEGEKYTFILSFDVNNNLKIVIDGTSYIILLRRSGE